LASVNNLPQSLITIIVMSRYQYHRFILIDPKYFLKDCENVLNYSF